MNYLEFDKNHLWHPFTQQWNLKDNILVEKAEGVYIHTVDGRKIIDGISSWWVNLFGHANPIVAKAIADQAKNLEHVIFADFTHKPAITMVEKLLKILPDNQERVFFSDNGSTSVEVGLKMAFQYHFNLGKPRKKVIAIDGSYHGDTFGAMSVAQRNEFSRPFDPFLFDVEFIPFPNGDNDDEVIAYFEKVADQNTSSFIFEPILQGTAGMRTYKPETLDKLIQIAQKNDIICIADEVMTGFGRTGKYFASLHLNEKPDIFCMSKGITGGFMALGLTSCCKKIHDAYESSDKMKTFFHGHSYTGNALASAAANASLDLLTSEEMLENMKRINLSHQKFSSDLSQFGCVKKINLIGTIISIEFQTKENTSYFNSLRDEMFNFFLSNDILLRPLGNVIYIIPPYVISNSDLQKIYNTIQKFIKRTF